MKVLRLPSLLLAALLHFAPVAKVIETALPLQSSPSAVVLKWLAATVAVAGSMHAVSGASVAINSPKTHRATNGIAMRTYRITTDGGSPESYTAEPLPSALVVGMTTGFITGTPRETGVFEITITAYDNNNLSGRQTSALLTLTVVANPSVAPPQITGQPANQQASVGGSATFTVTATGGGTLAYQWIKDDFEIDGATSATLAINPVTLDDTGSYKVRVSNAGGVAVSQPATLTVVEPLQITFQPESQTVIEGGSATFFVGATGTAPLSFQWRRNGTNVDGATSDTLTLDAVTAAQGGDYTVRVTDAGGTTLISEIATLTVLVPATITTQPSNVAVKEGGVAAFTVVASGTQPIAYQWFLNGGEIAGANASSLTINPVSAGDAGDYTVQVSNDAGSALSDVAQLAIVNPPTITTQPGGLTVNSGAPASFTVIASGTLPLAYQWFRNGSELPGAASDTLAINAASTDDAGDYTVRVSNAAGNVVSDPAKLTVIVAPAITQQPAGLTVATGGTAVFTVVATGSEPLTYEWRRGGSPVAGGNTATLTLTGVTAAVAGDYTVHISNPAGSATSDIAKLTVANPPAITTQPVGATVHPDGVVNLGVVAQGDGPLTYQWQRNGVSVPGATQAQLVLAQPVPEDSGDYIVVVTASGLSTTSEVAKVTVVPVALATPVIGGAGVTLTFPTLVGRNYVVEANNGLAPAGWNKLQDVAGTGAPASVNDPDIGQAFRAWRLILKAQ